MLNTMSKWLIIALAASALVACGDDDNNNATTNNGTTNNGTTNNGSTNNGSTNNGSTNNGSTNNVTPNNSQAGTEDVSEATEPSNSAESAVSFTAGQSIGGTIGDTFQENDNTYSDIDYFKVELEAGTILEWSFSHIGDGFTGENALGAALLDSEQSWARSLSHTEANSRQAFIPETGTYYLAVSNYSSTAAGGDNFTYVVETNTTTPSADEALTLPASITADAADGQLDIYGLTTTDATVIEGATVAQSEPINGELDTVIYVWDTTTSSLVLFEDDISGSNYDTAFSFAAAASTDYLVIVDFWSTVTAADYTLTADETDDSYTAPTELTLGGNAAGNIDDRGDASDLDYFAVTLQPGEIARVTATADSGSSLQPAAVVYYEGNPFGLAKPVAGAAAIEFSHPSSATESYTYIVAVTDTTNIPTEDGVDPANAGGTDFGFTITAASTTWTATSASLPLTTSGTIDTIGTTDWYEVSLTAGSFLLPSVSTTASDFDPMVLQLEDNLDNPVGNEPVFVETAGTAVFGVRDAYFRGGAGYTYDSNISLFDPASVSFTDSTDTAASGTTVTPPMAITGTLDGTVEAPNADTYTVTLSAGAKLFAWTGPGADVAPDTDADTIITITAPDGTTIVAENDDYDGQAAGSYFSAALAEADAAGDYTVSVEPFCTSDPCSGNGDYTLWLAQP